jgi:nitrate reductase gamma subunit
MTEMELLNWARGPVLQWASVIFVVGVLVRFLEMWLLGRKPDLSEPRASASAAGWRTVWHRSIPAPGLVKRAPVVIYAGYAFHVGFLIVLLFFAPHILLFKDVFGLYWPALPFFVVDAATVIALVALLVLLVHRLVNPVRRFLSSWVDYLVWAVTFLPLVTGYLAYHRMLMPYTEMLAWHILSVALLLVVFPFTKLMHTFTLFLSRWYNGAASGRKGVQL